MVCWCALHTVLGWWCGGWCVGWMVFWCKCAMCGWWLCAGDHSSPPSLKHGNWLHYTDPPTLGPVIYVLSISKSGIFWQMGKGGLVAWKTRKMVGIRCEQPFTVDCVLTFVNVRAGICRIVFKFSRLNFSNINMTKTREAGKQTWECKSHSTYVTSLRLIGHSHPRRIWSNFKFS